ncbi:MAG: SDR family oxidoreductase, partial [Gammaproteobacteria bacterium]
VVESKRSARIINIVLVVDGGTPGMVHGGAARAGVINMTRTLAREWGPHGILINAVAPGTIDTPGLDQYDKDALRAAVERLPVPRMGTAAEVATAVAFLASPAGDYITGEVLSVDGGEHLVGG